MNLTRKLHKLYKFLYNFGMVAAIVAFFYFMDFIYKLSIVFFVACLLSLIAYVIIFLKSKISFDSYKIKECTELKTYEGKIKNLLIILIIIGAAAYVIFLHEYTDGNKNEKTILNVIMVSFGMFPILIDQFHKKSRKSILIHDEGIMVNLLHINFLNWEAISYIELNEYEQSVFIHRPIGDTLQFYTKKTDFNSITSLLKSHLLSNRVLQKETHQQLH